MNTAPDQLPDIDGRFGKAWIVPIPENLEFPDWKACIGQWLVYAPHGHPFWSWYVASVIHLRKIEGSGNPHISFPGASHELIIGALSPEELIPPLDNWREAHLLFPLNLSHQIIVNSDVEADSICEGIVTWITEGVSPDSDNRSYLIALINNSAEHLRLGGHPE